MGTTIQPAWAEEMQAHADKAQADLDRRYGARQGYQDHPATCRCPECLAQRQAQFENGEI